MSFLQQIKRRYSWFNRHTNVRRIHAFKPWLRWLTLRPGNTTTECSGKTTGFKWRRQFISMPVLDSTNSIDLHLKLTTQNFYPRVLASRSTVQYFQFYKNVQRSYSGTPVNQAYSVNSRLGMRHSIATRKDSTRDLNNFTKTIVNKLKYQDRYYNHQNIRHHNQKSLTHNQYSSVRRDTHINSPSRGRGRIDLTHTVVKLRDHKRSSNQQTKTVWQTIPGKQNIRLEKTRSRVIENNTTSTRQVNNDKTIAVMRYSRPSITVNHSIINTPVLPRIAKTIQSRNIVTSIPDVSVSYRGSAERKTGSGHTADQGPRSNTRKVYTRHTAKHDTPGFVYSITPAVLTNQSSKQRDVVKINNEEIVSGQQLEQKIEQVINEKYFQFDHKPVDTRRITREALKNLERQLIREKERMGRVV